MSYPVQPRFTFKRGLIDPQTDELSTLTVLVPQEPEDSSAFALFIWQRPGAWSAEGSLSLAADGIHIRSFAVVSSTDDLDRSVGVTATVLRSFKLSLLNDAIRQIFAEEQDEQTVLYAELSRAGELSALGSLVSAVHESDESAKRGPGRPALPDDEWAALAETYLEELVPMYGSRQRTAKRLKLPPKTVAGRLVQAREIGWLTPTPAGKAGGQAGPRLLAWRQKQGAPK